MPLIGVRYRQWSLLSRHEHFLFPFRQRGQCLLAGGGRVRAGLVGVGGGGVFEEAVAAGLRLIVTPTEGMPVHDAFQEMGAIGDRPELGLGEDADPDFMQSTIGLVWRSLVLGLAVLALIWVSGWVGG